VTTFATRQATVLIPTHNHHDTLDLTVMSVLGQTVDDIEIVIIGDGVTPELRDVAHQLKKEDDRVRFMDLPKGPHHGEPYRDQAVREANSDVVCYLCDDDLLLPEHVEQMIELLRQADLAHCLNGHIDPHGNFTPYMADLASAQFRNWCLHPERNGVSLTGTAHTVAAYRRLPVGWEVPPPGKPADHHMWKKFLVDPELRAVTSCRVTALQFPSHLSNRASWPGAERRAELLRWLPLCENGDVQQAFDDDVRGALRRELALWQCTANEQSDDVGKLLEHIQNCEEQMAKNQVELEVLRASLERVAAAQAEWEQEAARLGTQLATARDAHETTARQAEQMAALHRRDLMSAQVAHTAALEQLAGIESTRSWRVRAWALRSRVVRSVSRRTRRRR
jgi:hypothetical protein